MVGVKLGEQEIGSSPAEFRVQRERIFPGLMLTVKPAQDSTDLLREPSELQVMRGEERRGESNSLWCFSSCQEDLEEREMTLVSAPPPLPCRMLSVLEPSPPVGLQAREILTVLATASAVWVEIQYLLGLGNLLHIIYSEWRGKNGLIRPIPFIVWNGQK